MKTDNCKCCGSDKLQVLIDLGIHPVAHNLLVDKNQEDAVRHPLCLHYCKDCGFIQINDPISPELLYKKYNFCFSGWKNQPHISAEIELLKRHVKNKEIRILEIGCNDGVFMKPLEEVGFNHIVGIEPNPYASKEAETAGFEILNVMFDKIAAIQLKEQYGHFDMVVLRQVLEHIPDLEDFFEALDLVLNGERLLFIEVPDFSNALQFGDCSTIWEEHPNYFTYQILEYLLNRKGYEIEEKMFFDFSGGAMSVLARKSDSILMYKPDYDRQQYDVFAKNVQKYAVKLRMALKKVREDGKKVFLYGTGARACTLVNGLGLGSEIDYAIDDQQEKQGYFMPGCRLQIISLDKALELSGGIFLLAVNHENESTVTKKILFGKGRAIRKIISLFSPNDLLHEVEKL